MISARLRTLSGCCDLCRRVDLQCLVVGAVVLSGGLCGGVVESGDVECCGGEVKFGGDRCESASGVAA
jgi:hypothetical protein